MKQALLISLAGLFAAAGVHAQSAIYRCPGNAYTNNATEAKSKGCKLVEGGNVTVVEGVRPQGGAVKVAAAPQASPKRDVGSEQLARESDMRTILEAELKKAEARHAELAKEYNNGEPEKLGPETRNNQKYLDRVAELKASITRNESDIAGIKRELARIPAK